MNFIEPRLCYLSFALLLLKWILVSFYIGSCLNDVRPRIHPITALSKLLVVVAMNPSSACPAQRRRGALLPCAGERRGGAMSTGPEAEQQVDVGTRLPHRSFWLAARKEAASFDFIGIFSSWQRKKTNTFSQVKSRF